MYFVLFIVINFGKDLKITPIEHKNVSTKSLIKKIVH